MIYSLKMQDDVDLYYITIIQQVVGNNCGWNCFGRKNILLLYNCDVNRIVV